MSGTIARVSGLTATAQTKGPAPVDAHTAKLRKAAGDFESLLVKQLLKEAKIGGSEKSSGYGDMAVDGLASAIERGGGLGLAKHIERAIHGGPPAPPKPLPTVHTAPTPIPTSIPTAPTAAPRKVAAPEKL